MSALAPHADPARTDPARTDPARSDPTGSGAWRWQVRRDLAALRDALVAEEPLVREQWLDARGQQMARERDRLLIRVAATGLSVLAGEPTQVQHELRRLILDFERHVQRLRDLAWDEVELELGGSE